MRPSCRTRCPALPAPDAERALLRALEDSPNRLRADALLLMRATGMRIGELTGLELDCVHEVPGSGAWLKIPLGKLFTVLKDTRPEQLLEAIRIVAAGESLLAPNVTRRLIAEFARSPRPVRPESGGSPS